MGSVSEHVDERLLLARCEVAVLQRRRQIEILVLAKCRWLPSMPESTTAQTMSLPRAANELCAASALTVLIDLLISA